MAELVLAVLLLGALVYVTRPIGRTRPDRETSIALEQADVRKNTALSAIVELEEEREMGKLSNADFERLRAQYEAEALEALKELDSVKRVRVPEDDPLEAEIAAVRKRLQCPNCGALRTSGGNCPQCDAP
jgi:rubrerythrin